MDTSRKITRTRITTSLTTNTTKVTKTFFIPKLFCVFMDPLLFDAVI